MSEWTGLKTLAQKVAELYAPTGVPKHYRDTDVAFKTAEWVLPALKRELGPLLEAAQAQTEINSGATRFNLEQELKKWQ